MRVRQARSCKLPLLLAVCTASLPNMSALNVNKPTIDEPSSEVKITKPVSVDKPDEVEKPCHKVDNPVSNLIREDCVNEICKPISSIEHKDVEITSKASQDMATPEPSAVGATPTMPPAMNALHIFFSTPRAQCVWPNSNVRSALDSLYRQYFLSPVYLWPVVNIAVQLKFEFNSELQEIIQFKHNNKPLTDSLVPLQRLADSLGDMIKSLKTADKLTRAETNTLEYIMLGFGSGTLDYLKALEALRAPKTVEQIGIEAALPVQAKLIRDKNVKEVILERTYITSTEATDRQVLTQVIQGMRDRQDTITQENGKKEDIKEDETESEPMSYTSQENHQLEALLAKTAQPAKVDDTDAKKAEELRRQLLEAERKLKLEKERREAERKKRLENDVSENEGYSAVSSVTGGVSVCMSNVSVNSGVAGGTRIMV